MTKSIFIISLLFVFMESNSQSINFNGGYIHYFLHQKNYSEGLGITQPFNYSTGVSFTKYFKKSSVEVGYYYGTKNFRFDFAKLYNNVKYSEIRSGFHHFPVIFSPRLFKINKSSISFATGMIFIKNNDYSSKNIYGDGTFIIDDGSNFNYRVGAFAHFGLKYSFQLNKSLIVFGSTYYNYEFISDHATANSLNEPTPDRAQVGGKIGLEWIFIKNLKYFNE